MTIRPIARAMDASSSKWHLPAARYWDRASAEEMELAKEGKTGKDSVSMASMTAWYTGQLSVKPGSPSWIRI